MKGVGGKRKTSSETSNDAAVVDFGAVEGGGGGSADGAVDKGASSFAGEEHTQLQKGEMEQPHVEDSEEEAADDDEEEEQEEEEEHADQDAGPSGPGMGSILGEGYFEVEAIRRKRVRRGQIQYFIKWREWPETDNTWEPLENLADVPDVVASFEASLKSGTGKHRKRKRKPVVHHIQPKKRLERSATPYSLRRFPANTPDNRHTQSAPLNDLSVPDIPAFPQTVLFADDVENSGDASSLGISNQANDNRSADAPEPVIERNDENEYDPKLSELKATTTNGYEGEKLAVQFQQTQHSVGTHHVNGQLNGDCTEPVQSGRCRGAKRRKSGSVKRFNKDSSAGGDPVNTQRPVDASAGTTEPAETGAAENAGQNGRKRTNHARPAGNIVKIVKPVGIAAAVASSMQDVLVTFVAVRSDGTEVLVDNKYLKAYHPLLLINFYEQHLRYDPALD